MRTTVELPDELFRKAKAAAALEGISLKQFFAQALQDAIDEAPDSTEYGQSEPTPSPIPEDRKFKSLTNSELEAIFLREEREDWDK